jgi:Rhodanese-like domain
MQSIKADALRSGFMLWTIRALWIITHSAEFREENRHESGVRICASKVFSYGDGEMESTISTHDLKSKLDRRQVTLVETLAPERYREAHIPGAMNIPPDQITELAAQLLPNKDAEIVTYCANTH